jgi:beta-galactosidase beta subunit
MMLLDLQEFEQEDSQLLGSQITLLLIHDKSFSACMEVHQRAVDLQLVCKGTKPLLSAFSTVASC